MLFWLIFISLLLSVMIMGMFYSVSKKLAWETGAHLSFECGFTSYFFSRFSFSIHYFLVALIFLFLDLEICVVMPLLSEMDTLASLWSCSFMLYVLWMGLLMEWSEGNVKWVF